MNKALAYDDVLLVPQYSDIKSRTEVSLKTDLGKGLMLSKPILSSPMDTISEASMAAAMGDANTNDNSMDVVNDKELDEGDEDDEAAQLAAAVAMSTNNNDTTEGGDTQGNESQFSDPSFVNQLLSDLPGVDMNDPQIQAAMAALGAGNKDSDDKEKDDDTK